MRLGIDLEVATNCPRTLPWVARIRLLSPLRQIKLQAARSFAAAWLFASADPEQMGAVEPAAVLIASRDALINRLAIDE